jgi:hypothetical protein
MNSRKLTTWLFTLFSRFWRMIILLAAPRIVKLPAMVLAKARVIREINGGFNNLITFR